MGKLGGECGSTHDRAGLEAHAVESSTLRGCRVEHTGDLSRAGCGVQTEPADAGVRRRTETVRDRRPRGWGASPSRRLPWRGALGEGTGPADERTANHGAGGAVWAAREIHAGELSQPHSPVAIGRQSRRRDGRGEFLRGGCRQVLSGAIESGRRVVRSVMTTSSTEEPARIF